MAKGGARLVVVMELGRRRLADEVVDARVERARDQRQRGQRWCGDVALDLRQEADREAGAVGEIGQRQAAVAAVGPDLASELQPRWRRDASPPVTCHPACPLGPEFSPWVKFLHELIRRLLTFALAKVGILVVRSRQANPTVTKSLHAACMHSSGDSGQLAGALGNRDWPRLNTSDRPQRRADQIVSNRCEDIGHRPDGQYTPGFVSTVARRSRSLSVSALASASALTFSSR